MSKKRELRWLSLSLNFFRNVANKAIREDHRHRHEKPSLELDWNPPRLTRTSFP